jgi:hypothetical protein
MTKKDIDDIISVICPNDEDFEKLIISLAYLKKELEALALEQEPCEDAELDFVQLHKKIPVNLEICEDVVSRQAMNECIETYCGGAVKLAMELRKLPSVNPQPKTGY